MITRKIALACGWHFTRHAWQDLVETLSHAAEARGEVWQFDYHDPGYQTEADRSSLAGAYDIAIGHSLGFLNLLQAREQIRANRYVALNGFGCFYRSQDMADGVDIRILKRMQRQLAKQPDIVLQQFRQNCALGEKIESLPPVADYHNLSALAVGLDQLAHLSEIEFLTGLGQKTLALSARQDQIVATALSQQQFAEAHHLIVETASHALMLTHTDLCCQQIMDFITGTTDIEGTCQA